jgi:hypothetical protein
LLENEYLRNFAALPEHRVVCGVDVIILIDIHE